MGGHIGDEMTSEMKVLFLGCRAMEGDPPKGQRAATMAHQLRPRMNYEGNWENQSVGEEGQSTIPAPV